MAATDRTGWSTTTRVSWRRCIDINDRALRDVIVGLGGKANGYVRQSGFGITAACRRYLSPLIDGEDYPPYVSGLPVYVTFKGAHVPKRLKAGFKV